MKFTKMVSMITLGAFLAMAPMAFATSNNGNGCQDEACKASGNYDISTFAIGGGVDADGALIPFGAAGGVSAGGGVAIGSAQGSFETGTIKFFGKKITIKLGTAAGELSNVAGGGADTQAGSYIKKYCNGDVQVGVYSGSAAVGVTGGSLHVDALGIAHSEGIIGGIAGQGTLDASGLTTNPWVMDSHGFTGGIAGQGSVGGFIGGGLVVGLGSADVNAYIGMDGNSYSESYRGIEGNTEYLGTHVAANTNIETYGYSHDCLIGVGFVKGGYIAAGGASAKTVQIADGGAAAAKANGSYTASGELNCNFNGSAVGNTSTSATPVLNGSIMTSSADMRVSANMNQGPQAR